MAEQCLILFQCPLFAALVCWIWCRGLGRCARNRGGVCWCFEFSEDSAVSQGDSTRSVNSDTVLVVGECFDEVTCGVKIILIFTVIKCN